MKNSSFCALSIALAISGAAHADEVASTLAVQRVVASIKADAASEFDCMSDDDTHRFQAPPAPVVTNQVSAADLAAAARQNRQRLARVERQLRSASSAR